MAINSLWNSNFVLYSIGMLFSIAGSSLSVIAMAVLVFEETNSVQDIAIIFAVLAICSLFGPVFGRYIDRCDHRWLLSSIDLSRGILIIFFLLYISYFQYSNIVLITYTFVSFTLQSAYRPSIGAFIPKLVGLDNIMRANSIMGLLYNAMTVIGFFVGGIIVAVLGYKVALLLNALTFISMAIVFLLINPKQLFMFEKSAPQTKESNKNTDLFMILIRDRIFLIPLTVLISAISIAPFQVFWPEMFSTINGGLFFALYALGAALAAIVIYVYPDVAKDIRITIIPYLSLPLYYAVFFVTNEVMFYYTLSLLMGFGNAFSSTIIYTTIQTRMPPSMRGRLFGIILPMETFPLVGIYLAFYGFLSEFSIELKLGFNLFVLMVVIAISVLFILKDSYCKPLEQSLRSKKV